MIPVVSPGTTLKAPDHLEGKSMDIDELEYRAAQLLARPLALVCRTPRGKKQVMSIRECLETDSRYIHVAVPDELDILLEQELGGET